MSSVAGDFVDRVKAKEVLPGQSMGWKVRDVDECPSWRWRGEHIVDIDAKAHEERELTARKGALRQTAYQCPGS
jgi:hypothetical protein